MDGEKITTSISYKDSARLIEKPTDENKISGILILLIGFIVLISQKKSEEEYLDGTQKELVNSRNLMPAKRYKSKLYNFSNIVVYLDRTERIKKQFRCPKFRSLQ